MSWLRILPVLFAVTAVGCAKRSLDREHDGGTGTIGPGSGGAAGGVDERPDTPSIPIPDPSTCGNGRLDPGEECDDANKNPRDGCTPLCQVECFESCSPCEEQLGPCGQPICGDGRFDPGEQCDDGNIEAGDGCAPDCAIEQGWRCPAFGHLCAPICGDGLIVGHETCDDNNTIAGDGCSDICVLEPTSTTLCGDGVREGAEECDFGGSNNNDWYDGCSPTCHYGPRCGDGVRNGPEECDLGAGHNLARYGNSGGCASDCAFPHYCGDGRVDVENGEQCDMGANNGPGRVCTETCTICIDCPF